MRSPSTATARDPLGSGGGPRGTRAWLAAAVTLLVALVPIVVLAGSAQAATSAAVWHMEDPATMLDSSGNGNTGTPTAITGVPGTAGNGYHFNGSSSAVRVQSSPSLNPGTADLTLTTHVKFSVVPNSRVGDYDLVRKGLSSTPGGEYKMEIIPNDSHTVGYAFCLFKDANRVIASVRGTANLADNAWHTISCIRTATALTVVVDGVPRSTAKQLGSISNTARLVVGGKDLGGDQYLGDMDEVTVDVGIANRDTARLPTNLTATPSATQIAKRTS